MLMEHYVMIAIYQGNNVLFVLINCLWLSEKSLLRRSGITVLFIFLLELSASPINDLVTKAHIYSDLKNKTRQATNNMV